MAVCARPGSAQHSYVVFWNGTTAMYGCQEGYRHQSGDLTRHCVNTTWTGLHPACTVDSVLPKAYLVMLIIGATLSVFVACIPYDFYRFRRRKKAARKHQERLSLMTRIAPGHAKMMTETVPVAGGLAASQRRFGFRSLIKAFRFMTEKMKTTSGEEESGAEAGTSGGVGEAGGTTSSTSTTAGNNGGLVICTGSGGGGGGGGSKPSSPIPPPPGSPNPAENRAARARMSAVLSLWTGRGQRAKSLDVGDCSDHSGAGGGKSSGGFPRQLLHKSKRNSLVAGLSGSQSAIQAAATTAATAVTAATAGCGGGDTDARVEVGMGKAGGGGGVGERRRMSAGGGMGDVVKRMTKQQALRHRVQLTPSVSVDSAGGCVLDLSPLDSSSSPEPHPQPRFPSPSLSSARYVQLSASIPEDTDESEDGACVGGSFKVTDQHLQLQPPPHQRPNRTDANRNKPMLFSRSLPAAWSQDSSSSSHDVTVRVNPAETQVSLSGCSLQVADQPRNNNNSSSDRNPTFFSKSLPEAWSQDSSSHQDVHGPASSGRQDVARSLQVIDQPRNNRTNNNKSSHSSSNSSKATLRRHDAQDSSHDVPRDPSAWRHDGQDSSRVSRDGDAWRRDVSQDVALDGVLQVAPLTQENVAALADGQGTSSSLRGRSNKDSDTTDSTHGREDACSDRNYLSLSVNTSAPAVGESWRGGFSVNSDTPLNSTPLHSMDTSVGESRRGGGLTMSSRSATVDNPLVLPRPRRLQRQLSQDVGDRGCLSSCPPTPNTTPTAMCNYHYDPHPQPHLHRVSPSSPLTSPTTATTTITSGGSSYDYDPHLYSPTEPPSPQQQHHQHHHQQQQQQQRMSYPPTPNTTPTLASSHHYDYDSHHRNHHRMSRTSSVATDDSVDSYRQLDGPTRADIH